MQVRQLMLAGIEAATPADLAPLQSIGPHLMLVFGSPALLGHADLSSTLRVAFPTAELVGCSTPGVATSDGESGKSLLLSALAFDNPGVRIVSTRVGGAADAQDAGERLGNVLRPLGVHTALCLSPGSSIDGTALLTGLSRALPLSRVFGGVTGADGHTLHNMSVAADQVVVVGFSNNRLKSQHSLGSDQTAWEALSGGPQGLVLCALPGAGHMPAILKALGKLHICAGFQVEAQIGCAAHDAKAALVEQAVSLCLLREG